MGSPPIPDRTPHPTASTSAAANSERPPAFRDRSPPRPHPGVQPARAPASVPFSPPKRRTGGSLKGKERAMEGDEEDEEWGDPDFPKQQKPAYRHLLGNNNTGSANPLRVISHIDIDAAYAAMEMARLGIPEDQPMAVQQWQGLIAVNYPARRFGITRHESPGEALKKCPHLKLVHVQTYKNGESEPGYWEGAKPETHKVSLDMYRKESRKIVAVFSEFCPVVEKASIDESYLDLTLPVRRLLLTKYPSLATAPDGDLDALLPSPSSFGIRDDDIDWGAVGNLIPVWGQKKDKVRRLKPDGTEAPPSSSPIKPGEAPPPTLSIDAIDPTRIGNEEDHAPPAVVEDEASPSPDPPEPPLSWSDICLSLGASLVLEIRAAVRERLGYTCSAGIGPNKMLAKLCSGWKKPNAQTILRHAAIPAFLRPLPFQKIRNLGGKLGTAVKETYEAETVGDLLTFSLVELKAKLGEDSGTWLWEIVRGIDYTEVETKTQVKSMLSSKNFRPYIGTYGEVLHWLTILATELHLRLTDARDISPGLWPKTITFTHRSPQFVIRSHQAPFPFTSTPSALYILKHGEKLVRIAMGGTTPANPSISVPKETKIGPYSNIQLSFSGLERLEEGQRGIEGFFGAAPKGRGVPNVSVAGEDARSKKRGATPSMENGKAKKHKTTASSGFAPIFGSVPISNGNGGSAEELTLSDSDDGDGAGGPGEEDVKPANLSTSPTASPPPAKRVKRDPSASFTSYTCPRCGQVVLPPVALDEDEDEGEEEKMDDVLKRLEAEHADWHVARDLLEKERKKSGWGLSGGDDKGRKSSSTDSIKFGHEGLGGGAKNGGKKSKGKKGTLTGFFRPKS
ncbi:hypothetical protein JCM11251_003125 [Rhodosporidiobolus azoricus]